MRQDGNKELWAEIEVLPNRKVLLNNQILA